jgi:hypothetical protein
MRIELELSGNIASRLNDIKTFNGLYAAAWMISGIKPAKEAEEGTGSAVIELGRRSSHDMRYIQLYKTGYAQALADLRQPLIYESDLPLSQEFIDLASDALGIRSPLFSGEGQPA